MLHQRCLALRMATRDDRQYDLTVTLDDTTSALYLTFLVEEEGTLSSLRAIGEVIDRHAVFCELYTDRGSRYFHMPKAGEAVSSSVSSNWHADPIARDRQRDRSD
jgi:hypothetical protein